MEQQCANCGTTYDDQFRSTVCPHSGAGIHQGSLEGFKGTSYLDKDTVYPMYVEVFEGAHLPSVVGALMDVEKSEEDIKTISFFLGDRTNAATLLLQLLSDIRANVSKAPVRGQSMGPVDMMRQCEDYIGTLHTMLFAFEKNAEQVLSEYEPPVSSGSSIDHETELKSIAWAAFNKAAEYDYDGDGDSIKPHFNQWYDQYINEKALQKVILFPENRGPSSTETGAVGFEPGANELDQPLTRELADGSKVVEEWVEPDQTRYLPQRIGLVDLARIMRFKLTAQSERTLVALDRGRTAVVHDVTGSALRIRKDRSENEVQRIDITSGNIVYDIERFLRTELPGLVKAWVLQDFADDLLIYLRKRGWPEHEIYPAIQQAVRVYSKVQQGEYPTEQKVAEVKTIPGVGSVDTSDWPDDPELWGGK